MELKLPFETIKGRMQSWLRVNRFYVRKSHLQVERITKIGMFLGSSNAQWRQDTQQQLEDAIKESTNKYIRLDLQRLQKIFKHVNGEKGEVLILTVSFPTEK